MALLRGPLRAGTPPPVQSGAEEAEGHRGCANTGYTVRTGYALVLRTLF